MATGQNFFHQANPGEAIGQGLATALFGDPAKAQEQQRVRAEVALRAAQAREAEAHGGLYAEQTRGYAGQNDAAAESPSAWQNWQLANQPVAPQTTSTPGFADFGTPMASPAPHPDKGAALAALIANMGQMQGDRIDLTKMMGAWGAFGGDDETARRGMIAQGETPGANFALMPQRADAISARDAGEDQTLAFGVARTNHATDIPVANIAAGAKRYGDDRQFEGTRYTAFSEAESRRAAAAAKADRVGSPKGPRMVSAAATEKLKGLIGKFADRHHVSITGDNEARILAKAITAYQQSGNLYDAVNQATARLTVDGQRAVDRDENGDGPPVPGARKAPDGKWYVQAGTNGDGSPAYSTVEAGVAQRWLPWRIGW